MKIRVFFITVLFISLNLFSGIPKFFPESVATLKIGEPIFDIGLQQLDEWVQYYNTENLSIKNSIIRNKIFYMLEKSEGKLSNFEEKKNYIINSLNNSENNLSIGHLFMFYVCLIKNDDNENDNNFFGLYFSDKNKKDIILELIEKIKDNLFLIPSGEIDQIYKEFTADKKGNFALIFSRSGAMGINTLTVALLYGLAPIGLGFERPDVHLGTFNALLDNLGHDLYHYNKFSMLSSEQLDKARRIYLEIQNQKEQDFKNIKFDLFILWFFIHEIPDDIAKIFDNLLENKQGLIDFINEGYFSHDLREKLDTLLPQRKTLYEKTVETRAQYIAILRLNLDLMRLINSIEKGLEEPNLSFDIFIKNYDVRSFDSPGVSPDEVMDNVYKLQEIMLEKIDMFVEKYSDISGIPKFFPKSVTALKIGGPKSYIFDSGLQQLDEWVQYYNTYDIDIKDNIIRNKIFFMLETAKTNNLHDFERKNDYIVDCLNKSENKLSIGHLFMSYMYLIRNEVNEDKFFFPYFSNKKDLLDSIKENMDNLFFIPSIELDAIYKEFIQDKHGNFVLIFSKSGTMGINTLTLALLYELAPMGLGFANSDVHFGVYNTPLGGMAHDQNHYNNMFSKISFKQLDKARKIYLKIYQDKDKRDIKDTKMDLFMLWFFIHEISDKMIKLPSDNFLKDYQTLYDIILNYTSADHFINKMNNIDRAIASGEQKEEDKEGFIRRAVVDTLSTNFDLMRVIDRIEKSLGVVSQFSFEDFIGQVDVLNKNRNVDANQVIDAKNRLREIMLREFERFFALYSDI